MSDAQTPSSDQSGYDVGYGKPPKTSQWSKGHSGNAAGKKKGDKSFGALFRKVAKKMVPKKVGKKTKMISLIEMLVKAALMHAINGNTNIAALVLNLIEDFGMEPSASEFHPKPGQIYRDSHGNPKIDLRFDYEAFSRDLRKLEKMFLQDTEQSECGGTTVQ